MNTLKRGALLGAAVLGLSCFGHLSCRKEVTTPPNPNEEELITSLQIIFTDSAGQHPPGLAIFRDIDGAGGANPSQWDTIRLQSNSTYYAKILLLDESKIPVDTISQQVLQEADEHIFCFSDSGSNIIISRTDTDINGLEIGLESKWKTGNASEGEVQVVLRHQPETKDGNCATGSSDIDVIFRCIVQ